MRIDCINIIKCKSLVYPRWKRFLLIHIVLYQALATKADIYHLHNPDTIPMVIILKLLGKQVIYDTHEDFRKRVLIRDWIPNSLRKIVGRTVVFFERIAGVFADATIATQNNVVDRLGRKAYLISNAPIVNRDLISSVCDIACKIDDSFDGLRAIYIGSITVNRGLTDMVKSLELVNKIRAVRLWLIGKANSEDLIQAEKMPGWQYVDYYNYMPQEKAFAYVSKSDVGLIVLRNVGGHDMTDPNKIYEYMVFGVPFIASKFASWEKKFSSFNAGLFIPSGDYKALATALTTLAESIQLRKEMGINGKECIANNNWSKEEKKLISVYVNILNKKKH